MGDSGDLLPSFAPQIARSSPTPAANLSDYAVKSNRPEESRLAREDYSFMLDGSFEECA